MTTQPPINTGYNTAPAAKPTLGRNVWIGAAAGAAMLALTCCAGYGIGSSGQPDPQIVTSPSPYKVTEYVFPSANATAAAASPAAPTKAAAATIEEGTWTVGEDFPAGTYKLREAATRTCYWGIYKSGTNQSNIIENGIVTGGRPTVTLKRGQDFESDCGTWVKTK